MWLLRERDDRNLGPGNGALTAAFRQVVAERLVEDLTINQWVRAGGEKKQTALALSRLERLAKFVPMMWVEKLRGSGGAGQGCHSNPPVASATLDKVLL